MLRVSLALLHSNNLCNRIIDNHQYHPLMSDATQLKTRIEVAAEELCAAHERIKELEALCESSTELCTGSSGPLTGYGRRLRGMT